MRKNDVFRMLGERNVLKENIPLMEVKDHEQLKELSKQGYYPGCTAEEWAKTFPSIPVDKVICTKQCVYPSELMYYDRSKAILFGLRIYNGQMLMAASVQKAEKNDRDAIEETQRYAIKMITGMEEDYRRKNYSHLLMPTSSEGSGNTPMWLICDLLKSAGPSPALYKAFIDLYSFGDAGANVLMTRDANALMEIVSGKSEEQKQATQKAMEELPDEITIFRGAGSASTPYSKAISWTTDISRAYFFASWRYDGKSARIFEGHVKKSDVIEYITDRNESEILVQPGKVTNVSSISCYNLDDFKNAVSYGVPGYDNMKVSDICAADIITYTKNAFRGLDFEGDHDENHAMRVALYACFLYRVVVLSRIDVNDTAKKREASKVYEQLLRAAVWHDTGREEDSGSGPEHGADAYELFCAYSGKEDKVVQFLMAYHCRPDEEADAFFRKKLSARKGSDLIWKAFTILKDADALDRCRFGSLSDDYIDVKYLRNDEAKLLLPVASIICDGQVKLC